MESKRFCEMCKKWKRASYVSNEISRSTLVFGPFYGQPPKYESRCQKCESTLCKEISKMIGAS